MRALCAAGLLLLSSSVALAAPDRTGVDLGVRGGYAFPFGGIDATRGGLSGWVSGAVPVMIEAGYRFDQRFTVGPYFQFAYAQVKENSNTGCAARSDCSGWIVRAGVQGVYHLNLPWVVVPWVGVGAGYEWSNYSGTIGSVGFSGNASGWEFLNLQVGGDYALAPGMLVGPFVGFSIARYDAISGTLGDLLGSSGGATPQFHEWLLLGARFVFSL